MPPKAPVAITCALLIRSVGYAWGAPPDLTGDLAGRVRGGYMGPGNLKLLPRMQEVGLNAAIVKFGGVESTLSDADRASLVRWARACADADLAFLPVFNFFGGHEPKWITDFQRHVSKEGMEYERTPCPAEETFWRRYVTARFVAIAEALRGENLAGICLDVEMYGADFSGYRAPCYCDQCYTRFLRAQDRGDEALPALDERAKALADSGLDQAYWDSQTQEVEKHARACREALHHVNPKLRIGVLHLDWDTPFHHGMARGFGTEELPAVCLTERTYSSGWSEYVAQAQARFRELGASVDLLCGVWHSKFPPAHVAENYYHCAKDSWGYWIYTMQTFEAPDYSPLPDEHEKYWAAMRQANDELDKLAPDANYESPLTVRAFEVPLVPLTALGFQPTDLVPYAPDAKPGAHPRLRRENVLYFYARAGDEIAFDVQFRQIGKYRDMGQFLLVQPDGAEMLRGDIRKDEPGVVRATAARTGVHGLILGMGSNACEVTRASHAYAVGALASRKGWLISKVPPLYLLCAKGAEEAVLWLQTEGAGEGLQATIETGAGERIYQGPIVRRERIALSLPEGTEYLVARFEKLPGAVMEDLQIGVERGLYPFAATSLAGLFTGG